MGFIQRVAGLTFILSLVACSTLRSALYDPLNGSGVVNRSTLTFATLNNGVADLVDYSGFAVPAGAANADHTFQGTLTLTNTGGTGNFVEVGTTSASSYVDPGHLPAFSFQFIQDGTHIFPVRRGLISTTHPDWYYLLEPGRVWKENSDKGFSRAAIPFSLQERGANCTHNGVFTFLFKSDGTISGVAFQIAGETCHYFRFNLWGILAATYTVQQVKNASTLIASYRREVAARMPVKPIAQLAVDYPAAPVVTANIGSDQSEAHMKAFGVAVGGVHYAGGCNTRFGVYPYCEVMDLPSYSVAKSVVGAIGLMRLEKRYPGSKNAELVEAGDANCPGSQWNTVTLLNALDMATGNFDSAAHEVDEGSTAAINNFFLANTSSAKAAHACSYLRKATPGTKWVYHTSDSFLLGAAMNAVYRRREGSSKDFYTDLLVEEIWKPLNMSPATYTTVRTIDSVAHPLTGYGLTFHRDDIVKVAEFLSKARGQINGVPMLDQTLLSEALRETDNHGLEAGSASNRYLHGFWGWNAASTAGGSAICDGVRWIPYMSGYGGIGIVMLPNDMVYYFVSDNMEHGFKKTLIELNKIRSIC